jgi:hypothetical protein
MYKYFQTKNPDLGKFWRILHSYCILWPLGLFYGRFVYFATIWYILCAVIWLLPPVCCIKKNLATLISRTAEHDFRVCDES